MITIYRLTDQIPVRVGEVTFWISPLSLEHRGKLNSMSEKVSGSQIEVALDGATLALKYSLKDIEGVTDATGNPYKLEFGPDGALTDDCLSEIIQLAGTPKLTRLALRWALTEISDVKDWRKEHELRIQDAFNAGRMSEKERDEALNRYPLDGVTVDFSAVRNLKKKQ